MVNISTLIASSEVNGPGGLFDFNATLPLVAIQFVLLMVILNVLFYSPLSTVISERNEFILTTLANASETLAKANEMTAEYEQQLETVRKQAQLEITNSQKIHKEILEIELDISQKYIDNLLDKLTKDILNKKEIALNIVLQVGELLENDKDIKVVYTRKTDVFVDLWERGRIANKADANLFVSIHCNAHNSQAKGAETWVLGTKRGETNFNVAKAENEVILLENDYEKHYEGYDPNAPESIIGLILMNEDYLDQSILFASYVQNNLAQKLKLLKYN